MIFVGNDWAEGHHDVYLMDDDGARLGFSRLGEGLAGVARFHEMVAEHASDPAEVVVGIETDRGLWVGALIGAGYQVYAINPMAVSRYRDRHSQGGAKSDRGDAKVLADLVRTDRHNHRPVAGDSPESDGIKIMARTHQNLIWARTRHSNQMRNALREYYPAALETFDDLAGRDTLAVLGKAPTPTRGARLTLPQIRAALQRAGRKRNLDKTARKIQKGLRTRHLTAPGPVENALGTTVASLVKIIVETNRQIADLEETLDARFSQHPDAVIYHSQPGLGAVLGARALGEFEVRPRTLHQRQVSQKLRRHVAHHHRIRPQTRRRSPPRPQPATLRRFGPMGILFPQQQSRSTSLLRPTKSSRRPPPPSTPSPRQPARRHPPRLPQTPNHLRRTHRLGPPNQPRPSRSLTFTLLGMLLWLSNRRRGRLVGSEPGLVSGC